MKNFSENHQVNIGSHAKPKFSKRHYCAIASLLKTSTAQNKFEIAQDLVALFQTDNPRFKFSKFAKASGIMQDVKA